MASPTLRDIARLAGVSANTVSKALRNHPKVGAQKREEIRDIAKRLAYRRNPALSAWMRHVRDIRNPVANETLAYVVPRALAALSKQAHGWMHRYYSGAMACAKRLGYRCETFALEDYGGSWERLARTLYHRGVRGIAISPLTGRTPPPFDDTRFCMVSIESLAPDAPIDWVATDHYEGMRLAVAAALARGHRRLGLIRSRLRTGEHERWRAGFTLYQADAAAEDIIPVHSEPSDNSRFQALRQWVTTHRPSAVISSDPNMPDYLEALGIRIPRDIAFITLDKEPKHDAIAGVNQCMEKVGEALIRLLAMKVELNETGPTDSPRSLLLEPHWMDGISLP